MRAHYFQHVPFEGLGSIAPRLEARGYSITCTPFYDKGAMPGIEEVDFLVVMGGPMSVNDEQQFPWLSKEKAFIREFIATGRPVLGICLGAQLIAAALGARVYANREKEIGWFPIRGVNLSGGNNHRFPPQCDVFQWHGETFDLPPGAVRLAESAACKNQAFQLGKSVIGLQFHLETTPRSARDLVTHCGDELVEGAFIQSAEQILSAPPEAYESINGLMAELLVYLAAV